MAVEEGVVQFYDGAHVLITGGTGFMGRILMEKLLRSCPGVKRIYLIIRIKKGVEPSQRLKQLLDEPIFVPLKSFYPDFKNKVTLIPGNCEELGLGLSEEDTLLLTSNVTHVFHGAATVRFDAPLKRALHINVQGVRELLLLCKDCPNLKSVIHISTAYSNCPLKTIEEKFYKAPLTGEQALTLLDSLDESQLNAITPELVKPWPNTYAFTKCIAEDVIRTMGKGLPLAVVRPSIVIGCNSEPIPGWIDNIYGPTGIIVATAAGLLRVCIGDVSKRADVVPVDMAVNSIICAAWEIGKKPEELRRISTHEDIKVYNFVTAEENYIYWGEVTNSALNLRFKIPPLQAIWFLTATVTKSKTMGAILAFFYHTIPAYIMDAGLMLVGKEPQLAKGYEKIHKFNDVLLYFSLQEWKFKSENTQKLWSNLTRQDKSIFHFDMRDVNWLEYLDAKCLSIREYILKEDKSTIPAARRKMKMLAVAHYSLLAVIYYFLAWLFYKSSCFILESTI